MFFWQSSQEVEELDKAPRAKPLAKAPAQAPRQLARIRIDTLAGMAISNIVALAIMISTAATLHLHGKTHIATAGDAAEALKPIAGEFAFALFCLGIVGTGLLAIPVLAGSAAYALGESQGWKCGLENKPWEAVGFYSVISVATLLGVGIELVKVDPIKALFWSAVINGFVAVPIMAAMMFVASQRDQMKRFKVSGYRRYFFFQVLELDLHLIGAVHDMVVRQDDTLRVHDESRAEAHLRQLTLVGHVELAELVEELAEFLGDLRIVDLRPLARLLFRLDGLGLHLGFDADHGGQDFLDHVAVRGDLLRDRRRYGCLPLPVRAGDKRAGEAGEKQTNEGIGPSCHQCKSSITGPAVAWGRPGNQ